MPYSTEIVRFIGPENWCQYALHVGLLGHAAIYIKAGPSLLANMTNQ
jgi:hypothetical protein